VRNSLRPQSDTMSVNMERLLNTLRFWSRGIRLYLSAGILLVTLEVWWWVTVVVPSTQLQIIRVQEIFAWLAIGLLALTLLIGPGMKVFSGIPGKGIIRDSRRMIGIGAAWFASLHAAVAYIKQFNGSNPFSLPKLYEQSLLLGVIGLICLLALAFTSVNAIMRSWGVWWFRLHRLVYVAALAGLMHAFMVGAHASSTLALLFLGAVAAIWTGLQLYILLRHPQQSFWYIITLSYGVILLAAVLNYGLTQHLGRNALIGNHLEHSEHTE
jgi:sulfoxide reductase heme-binding subunit YedZ